MRAFHDLYPFPHVLRQSAPGIACHQAQRFAGTEQMSDDMAADVAGGRGDDDHRELGATLFGDSLPSPHDIRPNIAVSVAIVRDVMGPLSDILAILRPESCVTVGLDAGDAWAIRVDNRPGTINCHTVTAGDCWLAVDDTDMAVVLTAEGCIILPSGHPFTLASDLTLKPAEARDVLGIAPTGRHNRP